MSVHFGRTAWGNDGSSSDRAAASARAIKRVNPNALSGLYWIKNPTTGAAFQVYCDMVTCDEDGETGWMLVASWSTPSSWTLSANTSAATFSTVPLNCASSNFGDFPMTRFRVHCAGGPGAVADQSQADWYYNWRTTLRWKEVWAPDGSNYQYYLSTGTNPAVPRCSLKPFNGSYNLKFRYSNPNHRFNNISDYGYTNTPNGDGTANIGGSNAGTSGFCNYWRCLTTPGYAFGAYNLSYTGDFVAGTAPGSDGTLGIPQSGAGTDTTGQDVDNNIAAKIGYDDAAAWAAATTAAGTSVGNNGVANTALYWWIK